jgi:hypothetical protein
MYYIEDKKILLSSPKIFDLTLRTMVGQYYSNHWVLIKDRKSRIIMKDGRQILEQIQIIKNQEPNSKVSLAVNALVCGKTTTFLNEKGIEILSLKKTN